MDTSPLYSRLQNRTTVVTPLQFRSKNRNLSSSFGELDSDGKDANLNWSNGAEKAFDLQSVLAQEILSPRQLHKKQPKPQVMALLEQMCRLVASDERRLKEFCVCNMDEGKHTNLCPQSELNLALSSKKRISLNNDQPIRPRSPIPITIQVSQTRTKAASSSAPTTVRIQVKTDQAEVLNALGLEPVVRETPEWKTKLNYQKSFSPESRKRTYVIPTDNQNEKIYEETTPTYQLTNPMHPSPNKLNNRPRKLMAVVHGSASEASNQNTSTSTLPYIPNLGYPQPDTTAYKLLHQPSPFDLPDKKTATAILRKEETRRLQLRQEWQQCSNVTQSLRDALKFS
eukprot:NODE_4614_length_1141_cov_38.935167_g4094_i0.p1 GENE.NODE_4614_length_1141_cov_38.935167_g4094_i0~~NODE_4614_length_1141_cov_38.935167_g4094_i0.p1  ORF type:complete len:353 (-),score=74.51 NODE_4614_length_1141_cov_38.935167_g4094_i0:83-1105(-)